MADPVSIASGASLVLGAGKSILGGIGQSDADQMQEQRAEEAAFTAKTNAYNTDSTMLNNSRKALASIDAIRASAGDNPDSPTGLALKSDMQDQSDIRRFTAVNNINDQRQQDLMDASYYGSASSQAMGIGILGGAATIAGGFAQGFGNFGSSFAPQPQNFGFGTFAQRQ